MGPRREETRVWPGAAVRDARLGDPDAPLPPPQGPPREQPAEAAHAEAAREAARAEAELARLDEMRAQVEAALGAIDRRVRDWQEARAGEWQELPRVAVELALALTTRLLHGRFAAGDFPAEALAAELLAGVAADAPAVVHLHPDDLALLEARLGGRALAERPGAITFAADPAMGRGDCRVEAGDAVLLAELGERLAEARRRLLEGLGHARA